MYCVWPDASCAQVVARRSDEAACNRAIVDAGLGRAQSDAHPCALVAATAALPSTACFSDVSTQISLLDAQNRPQIARTLQSRSSRRPSLTHAPSMSLFEKAKARRCGASVQPPAACTALPVLQRTRCLARTHAQRMPPRLQAALSNQGMLERAVTMGFDRFDRDHRRAARRAAPRVPQTRPLVRCPAIGVIPPDRAHWCAPRHSSCPALPCISPPPHSGSIEKSELLAAVEVRPTTAGGC